MSVKQVFNTSAELDYPTVLPTLDLDFANSKTLDPRITFTRSSGGSYVGADGLIKYAGVNEARFDHDPYTGESLGLLIEESRSNLFEWSETFVSGWSGQLGTVLNADTILNPYGVLGTVYYITVNEWKREFNANGHSTLALSFFAKRRFGGLNSDYNTIEIFQQAVSGGTLGTYNFKFDGNNPNSGQFQNIRTERYQNDWYRFSCTLVARPDYNGGVFATNARVDLEGGGADNYFWGIQVEEGAFPTSYIPTIGSTRTRAADSASITGTNFSSWYNPTEGSVYCRYNRIGIQSASTTVPTPWGVSDGTFSNCMSLIGGYLIPSNRRFDIINSGSATAQLDFTGTETAQTFNKVCVTYKLNDIAGSYNAQTVLTDTSSNIPSVNQLCIGRSDPATLVDYLNGNISRLTYYPKRLTNAQLQVLTS